MTVLTAVFAILVALEAKHFVADFPLQTRWMLGKFHPSSRVWGPALLAHAGVHALGTALISSWALFFSQRPISNAGAWDLIALVSVLDLFTHFGVDRLKVLSKRLPGCGAPDRAGFWNALGLDQAAHHLVQFLIAYLLVVR